MSKLDDEAAKIFERMQTTVNKEMRGHQRVDAFGHHGYEGVCAAILAAVAREIAEHRLQTRST